MGTPQPVPGEFARSMKTKMQRLNVAENLALPLDTQTSTLIVYGGKGMGKSNFARVLCEEHYRNGLRFSLLDPIGVNWGLRYGVDKSTTGIELVVLGGAHGDIPIDPAAGAVVADFVADEEVSTLVDISRFKNGRMWSHGEKYRFTAAYANRLFERQSGTRRPLMQLIDECGRLCPQDIPHGDTDVLKCVGAIEQLVEWGRNGATGVTLITQRSARMRKSVSELADCMISFRIVGPRSLDAVTDWLGEHLPKERIKQVSGQLRELPLGQALVISPGWLKFEAIAQMHLSKTFDSSETPKPGTRPRKPGAFRQPDLAKYEARMAETVARVEADNPTKLKNEVLSLKKELAAIMSKQVQVKPAVDESAMNAVFEDVRKASKAARDQLARLANDFGAWAQRVANLASTFDSQLENAMVDAQARARIGKRVAKAAAVRRVEPQRPESRRRHDESVDEGALSGPGPLKVLSAIVQFGGHVGEEGVTRDQLTVVTGYKRSSRDALLHRLGVAGCIEQNGLRVRATVAGITWLGDRYETLPTGDSLQDYWFQHLPGAEANVLRVLVQHYPEEVSRADVGERAELARSSRDAVIHRLEAKLLVEITGPGKLRASANLFD